MDNNVIFTICSNNYLAKAKVLADSIKKYEPDSLFVIFLCDLKIDTIDYSSFANEVIPIEEIEPNFMNLAQKYNIVELNTSLKPRACEFLLVERAADNVIFLDPDIKLYNSLTNIYNKLVESAIILTPHICTPIPMDHKTPGENLFNNFGIYNLGFIGLSNRPIVLKFLLWWKDHTYHQGFIDVWNGIFVDQLPINHAPIFFPDITIELNMGVNMAPWNLHERYLSVYNDSYLVNGTSKLIFYHFSSFETDNLELPQLYYNRYKLADRPDLVEIYERYNEELEAADHSNYRKIKSHYSDIRNDFVKRSKNGKWLKRLKKLFS